jgi:hypothetical protein
MQTLKKNQSLQIVQSKIKILHQNELLSLKWSNLVVGLGANDLLLSDFFARDKEPMQTHFITLSQNIPIGNKLTLKRDLFSKEKDIQLSLLEDKRVKYNSLIVSYLSQYVILSEKIKLLSELKKNIKEMTSLQQTKFKLKNINQISIIKNKNKILEIQLNIQKISSKKEILKLKLENISYSKIDTISYNLESMSIAKYDIDNMLINNNMYIALNKTIKKNTHNILLQDSLKNSNLKLNVGYYQRSEFDDYLAFSVSSALSIYGTENIKISKAKEEKINSQLKLNKFKNSFMIKVKTLLTNMKLAKLNFDLINSKILNNNKSIRRLLKSSSVQMGLNTLSQIKNDNDIIRKKLQANQEKMNFYKNKSNLAYYQGDTL